MAYTKYADSAAGAREFIEKETSLSADGVQFDHDPYVEGVWRARFPEKGTMIIYLAGYPDPFGQIRDYNDCESDF